jgi:predicted dienelactone hydrolase
MQHRFIIGAGAALTLAGAAAVFANTAASDAVFDAPGYSVVHIAMDHRDVPVEVHIWYPTDGVSEGVKIGENLLFDGFQAQLNAAPSLAALPVVVFSHGSGGKAVQSGWLASQLAAQGIIVVAPNHQGTMSQDSDPHQTPMIWQRNRDLSSALDALEAGVLGAIVPDMDRVAAVGFSLGGAAALSISGAGLSKEDFIAYCAMQVKKPDCDWMNDAGVDFSQIDQALYEADWTDPRISAVLAIDPALTQAMASESLAQFDMPTMTLGLGDIETIPMAVDASHLSAIIGQAQHIWIPGAAHFSFLPSCGIIGKIATSVMGDDNICSDWGLRSRDVVHSDIAEHTSAFLAQVFQPPS